MTRVLSKKTRLCLDRLTYRQLRLRILERDSWRCQACGAMTGLEVHHQQFRSQQGHDSDENLITLCHTCHTRMHG